MRPLWLALALAACASTGEAGWTRSGDAPPFENTQARCQIETQVVAGPAFEVCMAAHGWRRETAAHAGGYDVERTMLTVIPDAGTRTLSGVQATTIRAEIDLTRLRFDPNALVVDEIGVDGVPATIVADADGAILTLPRR
ncbi:MAG: hypothetical protein ABL932_22420, partial [Terricaulis sp.]